MRQKLAIAEKSNALDASRFQRGDMRDLLLAVTMKNTAIYLQKVGNFSKLVRHMKILSINTQKSAAVFNTSGLFIARMHAQ